MSGGSQFGSFFWKLKCSYESKKASVADYIMCGDLLIVGGSGHVYNVHTGGKKRVWGHLPPGPL